MAATVEMTDLTDETRVAAEIHNIYVQFLEDREGDGVNIENIKEMIAKNEQCLVVNINQLRDINPLRCIGLLKNGFQEMPIFQRALREVVQTVDHHYAAQHDEFFIGLEGSFGANHVTPRTLTSLFLGHTVCVEGIVTKCSLINPKVVRSVHYCPATKKVSERRYNDVSSFDAIPTANVYPTKDDEGNLLETEYGLSKYKDHQTITVQEMPEKAPTGQLPRTLDIVLDNHLVDSCQPGDRILVVGVYRCLPGKQGGYTTGVFRSILLASTVTVMHKDINAGISWREEGEVIRRFSKNSNAFNILARSLAPSIHGHEYIKKALLCLLLGGVEKTLENGTRLRGDINVLLIGDPSVAKSQMLRYCSNVAPRVVMTTGRGSSGVGLTAAVTTDHETGERRLEAGAMVLADRGIVCIDEFDKMSDADRTAIHEVMEQGKVTIAKAGIHARLNARTSVLAAANPLYGRYDGYKTPMENIGLQDSLLSRFDLLFIVKDIPNVEADRLIADHVLRMHRYRNPTEQDGEPTPIMQNDMVLTTGDPEEKKKVTHKLQVYEKHDPLLHGRQRTRGEKLLSMEFIRKYIAVAKTREPPQMTSEASRIIAEEYTRLRSEQTDVTLKPTQPITARSLETMIRLAAAHAKARFGSTVTREDANLAIELVRFAIFERLQEKESKKRKAGEGDGEDEWLQDDDEERDVGEGLSGDGDGEGVLENGNTPKRSRPSRDDDAEGDGDVEEPETMETEDPNPGPAVLGEGEIDDNRYVRFKARLSRLFEMEREEMLAISKILDWMMDPREGFSRREIFGGLTRLSAEDEGGVMISEGLVYRI